MSRSILFFFALTVGSVQLPAQSDDFSFDEIGFRFGADAENRVDLTSYEIFGTVGTPWNWQMTENVRVDLGIELAGGALDGEGETAAYGRIAPRLEFSYSDFPVAVVVASGPSLYSEDKFDNLDLGGNFQFTSTAGFDWQVSEEWALGYRFQHTSNADLGDPNPGLDMHTVSLGYTF